MIGGHSTHRIGDLMVEAGLMDRATAESVAAVRMRQSERFASVAVQEGRVSETDALSALSEQKGIPGIDLTRVNISVETLNKIPAGVARGKLAVPLQVDGSHLLVAMADPDNTQALEEITFACGMQLIPHVALISRLQSLLTPEYGTQSYVGADANQDESEQASGLPIVRPSIAAVPEDLNTVEISIDDLDEMESFPEIDPGDVISVDKPSPSTEPPCILVVDDEPDVQELIVQALGPLEARIATASRGTEALLKTKSEQPDVIVLDAMLPEIHGFEICKKIKSSKRFQQTRILMVSAIYRGWRMAEDIKTLYHADDFLEKPFRVAELRTRVEQLLQKASQSESGEMREEARAAFAKGAQAVQRGNHEEALEVLTEALSADPFSPKIHILLGQATQALGKEFQAIYHYERAVELDPSLFSAAKCLALLYQEKGFRHKALEMWERALWATSDEETRTKIKQHIVSFL